MAVEDYLEPEVAVAVAITAAVASPRARRVMRQGAVYGLAGILKAGDALGGFSRGIGRGMQATAESGQAAAESSGLIIPGGGEQAEPAEAPARARSRTSRPKGQEAEGGEA